MNLKERVLVTRKDTAELLLDMIRPLKKFYSEGHAWLHVGDTGVNFGVKIGRMEGFSRILWGLGPLWSQDNHELSIEYQQEAQEWCEFYLEGLRNGTNPMHQEYWGEMMDTDQKMVEMAAIVCAFMLSPKKLWEPLSDIEKNNMYQWLNKINEHDMPPNNWRFFRILVNVMFEKFELPWSMEKNEEDWEKIESFYTGDGWYYDGHDGQVDYYISFAIQYYALLYVHFMKHLEPERCAILQDRATLFSRDFVYWFANNGNEIPFGRSLTYRFAHSAFFAAMGLAEVDGVGYGKMKNLILNNIMQWIKRPIFDKSGILTVGYGYPNLFMTEFYNSPGSPYWAFKAFYLLAMPESHPFWQAKMEPVEFEVQKCLPHPRMIISHVGNHVMSYPVGQHAPQFGHSQDKYEKFVYSNQFAFSVSRGTSLVDGAFDNTIAVSVVGENIYRTRYGIEQFDMNEDFITSSYQIMMGVQITSTIIPCGPWHVRIHNIKTDKDIDVADGGFAIPADTCFYIQPGSESGIITNESIRQLENELFVSKESKISGIVSLSGGVTEAVAAFPNTNLLHSLTLIPTIKHTLKIGSHQLISCVCADASEYADSVVNNRPDVAIKGNSIIVKYGNKLIEL